MAMTEVRENKMGKHGWWVGSLLKDFSTQSLHDHYGTHMESEEGWKYKEARKNLFTFRLLERKKGTKTIL